MIRNKLVLRNHFLWPICCLLQKDMELLALRINFRATKKFLIAKFDCINISPILTHQKWNSVTKLTLMVRRKGCPKGARACQMLFRVRLVQLDRAVQMHTVRIFINCGSVQKVSNAMIDNWLGKSDLVPFWQPAVKVNWTFFLTFFFSFLIADFSLKRSHKKTCETKTHEILTECLLAHLLWTTRRRASYFPVCRWIVMTASSFFPRKACMYNIKFAFRFKL